MYNQFSSDDLGVIVLYVLANYTGGFTLPTLTYLHEKDFAALPNSVIGSDALESGFTYTWKGTTTDDALDFDILRTFYTIDGDTMEIMDISTSASPTLIQSLIDG